MFQNPNQVPLPPQRKVPKWAIAGTGVVLLGAAVLLAVGRKVKPEAEPEKETSKEQELAQAERRRLAAEMGRKGGKKSAETRRKQKVSDEEAAGELQP